MPHSRQCPATDPCRLTMRVLAVLGEDAERAAAGLVRMFRAEGHAVTSARLSREEEAPGDFVPAIGGLLPNPCFWTEWATGRAGGVDPGADITVLAVPDPGSAASRLSGAELRLASSVPLWLDGFGRPSCVEPPLLPLNGLCIGICGDERHHRVTYPAVLATLGDAADRMGWPVELVFLSAAGMLARELPAGLHGVILPGGSDMAEVEAQIAAARAARAAGLPVLGLCLGMQSMATMVLRDAGDPGAVLEEVAGPGPGRSFVRLSDAGAPWHRLGERILCPLPGTQLAAVLTEGATIRMNHRYRLEPKAVPGLTLHTSAEQGITDAIELPGHPFFIGLQGHPELGCDPALDRLWDAFLEAAETYHLSWTEVA